MYDKILVPLDGSKRAETILPYVQKLARESGAKIILLSVIPHEVAAKTVCVRSQLFAGEEVQDIESIDVYLSNLTEAMRKMNIQTEFKVVCGPAVRMIIETAQELDAGLIAIASHGRSGLGRVFYGSIAVGVLQSVDRPLFIIRSRNLI